MLFPTVDFAVFFAVVLAAYWATRQWALGWRLLLVAASYFFYAYWDPAFCLLLGGSTAANWALGAATHRT
ncbi:MAG: MBOAT family protein, partial [Dehalococcoidia bacterium]|nr:MBOAT family protein [Dehalococcoidia bacterium]